MSKETISLTCTHPITTCVGRTTLDDIVGLTIQKDNPTVSIRYINSTQFTPFSSVISANIKNKNKDKDLKNSDM